MDLLAPCRSCLQCLPFFHVSPASPPPGRAPPVPSSPFDASKAAPTDPSQGTEALPCPSAAPTLQEQDPCLPVKAEEEPQAASYDKDDASFANFQGESKGTESEALPVSGIVIAPPVSSPVCGASLPEDAEDDKMTTIPELPLEVPFINDITFSGTGFLPLQSPITPVPIGAGYPAGQYPPHDQINQDGHSHVHHGQESEQHDPEYPVHGHESSHHLHHWHGHLHHGHSHSHDGDHELHKHASHHHSHHHTHDSPIVDDADNSVTGQPSLDVDHHDKADDISPTPTLEASQSTPELDLDAKDAGENSAATHTNGASVLLETYHSEPVVLSADLQDDDNEPQNELLGFSGSHGAARRRRRDHFRDQFKGIRQQIKQGGHHMKEEGSKHMQNIIENMNKQAQQIEQSGSFFMVPR